MLGWLRRPECLIFLPALTLAGFWLGGERVLILLALGGPLIFALAGVAGDPAAPDLDDGPPLARAIRSMDRLLPMTGSSGRNTACLVVQFDGVDQLLERHGRVALTDILARAADRIRGTLRVGDLVAPLRDDALALVLAPSRRLDLEAMVQLCVRLQAGVAEPVSLGGAQVYLSCSIGFCIGDRAPAPTGQALLDAAQAAADEASRKGPGALRAWSLDIDQRRAQRDQLRDQLEEALDRGDIRPHFQPQLSTDTGAISGFEALARWHHPERGCLSPAEFLPAVEDNDLGDRLGEVMLYHALSALAAWDRAGHHVPAVAVNFAASELRNPRLPEKIRWELDRFDLAPQRLSIEILETVIVQTDNDVIVSNIAELAAMGCGVDLDDFGTGHSSIATIRRFAVRRLKIDRSFVMRVDQDRDQQRMVAAIVSMADRLGLDTLAEGVETPAEHAMLGQLGCGHVQGFGIGMPMTLEDASDWLSRHATGVDRLSRIGLRGV